MRIILSICVISLIIFPVPIMLGEDTEGNRPEVYGLFVGVANYDNILFILPFNDLRYSDNDAFEMGITFAEELGWLSSGRFLITPDPDDVGGEIPSSYIHGDASWQNIKEALLSFSSIVQPDDYFIFCYSGHGWDGGITVSGNAPFSDTAISYTTLFSYLDNIESRASIIILDTCHAGSITNAQFNASGDYCVLASCRKEQYSYESSTWDGGVFTYYLINNYKTARTNNISIDYRFNHVIENVKSATDNEQIPLLSNQYIDFCINLGYRIIQPILTLDFPIKECQISGHSGDKKMIEIVVNVENVGTASANNVNVELRNSLGEVLGKQNIPKLSFGKSTSMSISIIVTCEKSTERMIATASLIFNGKLYTYTSKK